MEEPRQQPVSPPDAGTGDNTAPDWKVRLDRLEAKTDRNNRLLKICISLLIGLIAVLCVGFGVLFYHGSAAYRSLLQATEQVDTLAGTLQDSLDSMEPGELDRLLQSLPDIAEKLSQLDVDALNQVISEMPDLMQAVEDLERQTSQITGWFSSLGGLFR